jgi:hypothetical protein
MAMVAKIERHVNNGEPKISSGYPYSHWKSLAYTGICCACAGIGRPQKVLPLTNDNVGVLEKWLKVAPIGALAAKRQVPFGVDNSCL